MQVAVIGVGHVGASVAVALLQTGAARELLLHDHDHARAEGEAMDLAHGVPYYPRARVRAVTLDEAVRADVVVFAAGRNGRPGETRLQLLADNVRVAGAIGRRLAGSAALVVVVSNPVDVLTRVMQQASGLPPARVLGTGTMLDTARLRERLGQHLGVDARSVHAQVLGEHGDSEFVQWSAAQVGGRPLRQWPGRTAADEARLGSEVRRAAYEIIQRKGVTNHAIGLVTADLVRAVVRDEHRVLTVSRLQDGDPALADVALSLPAVVSRAGAGMVITPTLDEAELAALQHSAGVLRQAWSGVASPA
jgi:L-lactate dehydrogenase